MRAAVADAGRSRSPATSPGPRPFVTVAYVPGSGSMLVPAVMLPSCVHAAKGDPACVLVVHHLREWKPVRRSR